MNPVSVVPTIWRYFKYNPDYLRDIILAKNNTPTRLEQVSFVIR